MTSADCDLKLLYVTPEKLAKSKMFMNKLQAWLLTRLFLYIFTNLGV